MAPVFGIIVVCVFFLIRVAVRSVLKEKIDAEQTTTSTPAAGDPASLEQEQQGPQEETHDHIRSTALSPVRQLEQLETLRGAGLLTEEEYRGKKREIMSKL